MKILSKLVKKNLLLNKKRTIVTIISIVLSCALICGVATLIASFQRFMQDIIIESEGNHHVVLNDLTASDIKYIKNNDKIETITISSNIGFSNLDLPTSEYEPYIFITSFSKDKLKNSNYKIIEGRMPRNDNEIIISDRLNINSNMKYKINDEIILNIGQRYLNDEKITDNDSYYNFVDEETNITYKEQLLNTVEYKYEIVGIVDMNYNELSSAGFTAITYLNEKKLDKVSKYNVFIVVKNIKNVYKDIELIRKKLNLDINDVDYHNSLLRWYGISDNDDVNQMLFEFELILIGIIMIASIIVIYNSFNISITERKKQFGILSSVGATKKQIRKMVLKEGFFLSLIGIPIGIFFGVIGIGITLMVINNLNLFIGLGFTTKLHLTIIPLSLYITIFFGSLTIFLSSLIPAFKASRISPIDAIRLSNEIKSKSKKFKTLKIFKKIFGIEGDLAFKSMKRNRKKYRSTVISLFVSIVLFMAINAFAEYSIRSVVKVYNTFNFNVGISDIEKKETDDILKLNYIDSYSTVKTINYELEISKSKLNKLVKTNSNCNEMNICKINFQLSTLGNVEFKRYIEEINESIVDYKDISNMKIILIKESNYFNYVTNKFYQLSLTKFNVNDKIKLMEVANNVENHFTIGKITSKYPLGFNNISSYDLTIQGFISDELYDSLDDSVKTNISYLFMQSSNPDKLVKEINKYEKANDITLDTMNIDELVNMLKNINLAISIFLYGFIVLILLISITNVINTITTSIYLRKKEFATLKSIGMINKDFNKMIRIESLLYGLKSLLYGLPVGIWLDYVLYKQISSMFIYDYQIPYKPIIICMSFVFVIIAITMSYSVRRIKNENIIDILKEENQ